MDAGQALEGEVTGCSFALTNAFMGGKQAYSAVPTSVRKMMGDINFNDLKDFQALTPNR